MILFFKARQEMKKDFQFSFLFFHLFMSKMFVMRRNDLIFTSLKKYSFPPLCSILIIKWAYFVRLWRNILCRFMHNELLVFYYHIIHLIIGIQALNRCSLLVLHPRQHHQLALIKIAPYDV